VQTCVPGAILVPVIAAADVGDCAPGVRRVDGEGGAEYLAQAWTEIPLPMGKTLSIGRSPVSVMYIDIPDVSRAHAEVRYADGVYQLRDVGSQNGTYLNDQRLEAWVVYTLHAGDTLRFGTAAVYRLLIRDCESLSGAGSPVKDQQDQGEEL
jgi:FHA domain